MSSFEKHLTKDGWTYGKGSYEKKIANYLGIAAPSFNTMVTIPASITGALSAGASTAVHIAGTYMAKIAYGKIANITIPTYYIFATSPTGKKTVAEWPLSQLTRDAVYTAWVPLFVGAGVEGSAYKQAQISNLKASKAPIRSMGSLLTALKTEVDLYFDQKRQLIRRDVGTEATSVMLVLGAAAILGFIAFSN